MEKVTNEKQPLTGNELIAEFMGLPLTKQEMEFSGDRKMKTVPFMTWRYDTSWDWLMDACKKWDETNFPIDKNTMIEFVKRSIDLDNAVATYDIQLAYQQLVKNIKWYNEKSGVDRYPTNP